MLRERSHLNRYLYQQRISDAVEAQAELQQPTAYTGFDAVTGLARLQDALGNIFYGSPQTNGAIGKGENIRLRRKGIMAGYDAMPNKKQAQIQQIIPKTKEVKFLIWDMITSEVGADIPVNFLKVAVNLFLGEIKENVDPKYLKKHYSEAEVLPDIKGLKLLYIPSISRGLTSDEISRLVEFQQAGGIIYIAACLQFFDFVGLKEKVDEIMIALNSPLRALPTPRTNHDFPPPDAANFPTVSTLTAFGSSEVLNGTPICYMGDTPYVWIAYDKASRTILSGDAYMLSQITLQFLPNENSKFAQSLLTINWDDLPDE